MEKNVYVAPICEVISIVGDDIITKSPSGGNNEFIDNDD